MHNDVLCAADGVKGLADQMFPGLHQYLNGHIVRDVSAFDEFPADFIFGFRSGGKTHLDLLESHIAQGLEKLQFLFHIHGIHQCLIAIPQVNAAPNGRLVNHAVRPLTVGQMNLLKGDILLE